MAPSAASPSPSKTANGNQINEAETIKRGLEKLKYAFTDNLENFQPLLKKCQEGVTASSINGSPHKDVLCEYITSAVRGTYGNSRSKGQGRPGPGPGPGPAPVPGAGSGVHIWSGLKHTYRCNILRICMKYLMNNYCVEEKDITTILTAMEERVRKWTVGGDGKPDEKTKNRRYFDKCIKKSWKEEKSKENRLRCRVIKIIQQIETNTSGKWSPLKTLPGAASGTCSTITGNASNNKYGSDCSSQPNGTTAGGGGVSAGGGGGAGVVGNVGNNVDDDDDSDDDEEDDDDDDDDGVPTPSTAATSSLLGKGIGKNSQSLPGGSGKEGKGTFLSFPSLSSFPFDSIHPYLPLVPSILGIMTITYFLWKYFGQLGKIRRSRRAPLRIPGPSVQEQLLDHVEEAGPHEYRLVKERKPRSAPTRTKRSGRDPAGSGRVNRRTIIEIHFEVLDECQKGDTQLNQKDFLELLVREFMGSEFMEEEQVPKEEVLMEGVPMELVPMESVPSLGSGLLV
ncbi:SICAvar, type II [Plasmodium knowlesi strain H]|uniref:SICAvar, type II n=3 Tax=Plasmodium knowlesi TaxID=5850 RepID=A0A5K1U5E3_PLAKH|nr:SICAvar, type II [Plasmodium knowlesi strain H]OTN68557.1 SICAvar type II [Plasmodium knowlesi]CAA9986543.1 SICAvar, type II [Plasmodium knowlesi strain H]SBO24191.1 SICAvar, type II [Plasmodium knowlesi strain H]SBO29789.1 SICAvar, type II [Plasmodium knowlesi strain H]VVS76017.1 SICAvar, type II [Plasmodium knowlesi strain H]